MNKVCVDASLVLKWITPEDDSEQAMRLYRKYHKDNTQLIASSLLDYEVGTTLRQKVIRNLIESDDVYPIIESYKKLNILLFHVTNLVFQAISVAATIKQPTIYDIGYLLTAKQQKVDYVTADNRFYKAAHNLFPFVKLYSDLI